MKKKSHVDSALASPSLAPEEVPFKIFIHKSTFNSDTAEIIRSDPSDPTSPIEYLAIEISLPRLCPNSIILRAVGATINPSAEIRMEAMLNEWFLTHGSPPEEGEERKKISSMNNNNDDDYEN